MALSTYSEIKASVARWLNRDDMTALIPDFITMAESRLNDRLRLAPMEKSATFTLDTGAVLLTDENTGQILIDEITGAFLIDENSDPSRFGVKDLPSDFLEARSVVANTSPSAVLRLASPNRATESYERRSGYPDLYTIVGSIIAVYPVTTASITLTYYGKIPALSDEAETNWLLTRYPQMYLYAALLESAPVLIDDARAAFWRAYLDQAIIDATASDRGSRWSNAGLHLTGPIP